MTTDYVDFTHIDMSPEERLKLDVGDIFLNQGKALCCGRIIRSKNRHDFVKCKCGKAFIDGGSWYTRIGGDVELHIVNYANPHTDKEL
jgi:hypothetical protein